MMKKLGAILLLALILVPAGVIAAGSQDNGGNYGNAEVSAVNSKITALTDEEIQWLTYMREEEKLARDVYLSLYDKWNMRIFGTIAASEQKHTDAVNTLLVGYGIPDPAAGNARGEFTNPALQDLYDQMIQQGSVSKVEALKVGVFIEETDIDDLNAAIATATHKDIKTVYSNLLKGSLNHLDAFESQLAKF
jgi:hypothetical protein